MKNQIVDLITGVKNGSIDFKGVIAFIEQHYTHTPTAFKNGEVYNDASQNQGSAKVFSFAGLNSLSEDDTLSLFAEHYGAVLDNPTATDHQNIRQFMAHGWQGIVFEGEALAAK
ncbi:HopJ type III effector protein [Mucilaginibacter glaciei]|uniref:HopJ type III effector protein n=1 Tax=Mucilaginibacter glaciei TaxID=2772109 RepID=A0A926S1M6_9SPHI|nr:HopJ type III effector protein [Mucilaginibacter glaciei]MBD1393233.1 HopJ type III effector protein [Mucilaginibacter glaciei]